MAQRHMRPSMGALHRSLTSDVAVVPICASRAFHLSAPRLEDGQPSGAPPSAPVPTPRKVRSAIALAELTALNKRRSIPGGLARGHFPSGRTPQSSKVDELGFLPEEGQPTASSDANSSAPSTIRRPPPRGSAPPRGQMVRAPAQLRITREATDGPPLRDGSSLRGRGGARGGARGGRTSRGGRTGGPRNRGDAAPKGRGREKGDDNAKPILRRVDETHPSVTLSDGMVHHLLRLQRKEWDRTPYEPKYAPGSFAANELIHTGRELFRGESPPVKIWGPLEKRIGVVGMFGAEAHLQIRRVGDGDAEPFGQEVLEDVEMQDEGGNEEKKKEAIVQ